jgi:hypothetical protein
MPQGELFQLDPNVAVAREALAALGPERVERGMRAFTDDRANSCRWDWCFLGFALGEPGTLEDRVLREYNTYIAHDIVDEIGSLPKGGAYAISMLFHLSHRPILQALCEEYLELNRADPAQIALPLAV